MDIKEEPCMLDLSSKNERELCSKHLLNKIKSETATSGNDFDINTRVESEEEAAISSLGLLDRKDFVAEDTVMQLNRISKHSEIETKIEIKEEEWWLKNNLTYDDIKNETDDSYFIKSPSAHNVSSRVTDSFSNQDLRNDTSSNMVLKDSPECESEESYAAIELSVHSEKTDHGKVSNIVCCLKENHMLPHSNANKSDINKNRSILQADVPSCNAGLFSSNNTGNDTAFNMRKDSAEYQNHESDVTDISSILTSACSETVDNGEILDVASCLKSNTTVQESCISEKNCKSVLSCEYRNKYKCDFCDKTFAQFKYLKQHKLIHEAIKSQQCDICGKTFTYLAHLRTHILAHEGRKPYGCDLCDKKFTRLQHLKTHKLKHEGINPHKCDICDKAFTRLDHLKAHKFTHESTKPGKCDICNKDFNRLSTLRRHKFIHEGIKPYKCDICDKAFSQLTALKRHKMVHEGIKPYKCDICNKAFIQLDHLKRHKFVHEGIKPNKCDICNKTFTQLYHLKKHKLIHEDKKPNRCDICNKTYTHLHNLKKHKLIHERVYKCDICNNTFTRLYSLRKHKLSHEGIKPHKCDICDKGFLLLQHLKRHTLIHNRKPQ